MKPQEEIEPLFNKKVYQGWKLGGDVSVKPWKEMDDMSKWAVKNVTPC